MIADRPYMRGDPPSGGTSALTWLMCAIVAGFLLQVLAAATWFGGGVPIEGSLATTVAGLKHGHVWTLVTHAFLHSRDNLLHIVTNLFLLYLLGRELQPMTGSRLFLGLFGAAVVAGALVWTAVHWQIGSPLDSLVGATAGVMALAVVFACLFPEQEMDLLLLFVFPVTVKPKHLVIGVFVLEVIGLFFFEIPDASLPFGAKLACSAHLAGMAVGWLYYRFVHDTSWRLDVPQADPALPRWLKRERQTAVEAPVAAKTAVATREDLKAEVDRILDKINSHGLGALTVAERRALDSAREQLSRR